MIKFTYEIIKVDAAARCMELVYTSPGRQSMHIGMRLPFEGETVEQIAKQYSPEAYWLEQDKVVVLPEVGHTGTIESAPAELTPAQIQLAFSAAGQRLLDTTAQAWQYNDIASAATYLSSAIPQFKAEAEALVAWRDNFWWQAGLLAARIKAGDCQMPADVAAFLALLPSAPGRPTAA